ncbi:sigma-54-dependent transcriptional regulator [Desulfoplanes formicivorans]|uniref:Fis family transcriptional regulator n=1 Tax=Desulfoplanes formicivorans TaxID=1592317 RepID=A0A194ACC5_9BACT|nr:sigma-54 dependent transcriptional regulator [Desulfoplanes formicivorans]GAU07787.1 Fis family transcriptional regulator [Desulfoplanes formicivorans]
MSRILVIDDDIQVCETMHSLISRMQLTCENAQTLTQGLERLEAAAFDVVFLDVHLPDGDGLDALPTIKEAPSKPEVIILTGKGDPDGAELAIKGGVWDYLVKPSPIKNIMLTLNRVLAYRKEKKRQKPPMALNLEHVIGKSPVMRACFDLVAQAAQCDSNVLITGETGTGKELFARTIHANSLRANGPFIPVDCAALTETILESILFGHVKGAFTGADRDRTGLVKQADTGTLFLDEIGELPVSLQKTFLRFLQERTFRPVGDHRETQSDFRLIAATNRDLETMVLKDSFREDLYFRLKTILLPLPPLRQRKQDIKPLALYFIDQICNIQGKPTKGIDGDVFAILEQYHWRGNVRELANTLERAVVAAGEGKTIFAMHLPPDIRIKVVKNQLQGRSLPAPPSPPGTDPLPHPGISDPCPHIPALREFRSDMEKRYLQNLMQETRNDLKKMLKLSGLSRSHFYALIKKHGIDV